MARTRSSQAHNKVFRAALSLFGERGIDATSMDAIARASGVSKATIYNHWADKEALLLEVMDRVHGIGRDAKKIDGGDPLQDLIHVLTRQPPAEFARERARLTPTLIAYSATHQEFGRAWRHRVMQPARDALREILQSAIRRGLLRTVDMDVALALLLGPLLYHHIFQHERASKPVEMGSQVAEAFWRAFAIPQSVQRETASLPQKSGGRSDATPKAFSSASPASAIRPSSKR